AARAAAEHIEKSRVEREHYIEASHERAEPLRESEPEGISEVETDLETAGSATTPPRPEEESGARRRGRRGGRRRGREFSTEPAEVSAKTRQAPTQAELIETPFVIPSASFERISDDEERATNGEMLKDARLQERIMDEVHAAEFDMEDLPSAPVGSLLSEGMTSTGSCQRIEDDSEVSAEMSRTHELVPARVREFVDEIVDESSSALSFERVSDDAESELESKGGPIDLVRNLFRRGKKTEPVAKN